MRLFSILSKPAVKANNKQAGIVFLEYVIMAFIATVAVICAIWWFYWHLQQMTWEIKDRLNNLPRTCPLEAPYGAAPEDQPAAFYQKTYELNAVGWITIPDDFPFPHQKVEIQNTNLKTITGQVFFRYNNGGSQQPGPNGVIGFNLGLGEKTDIEYNHEDYGNPGPYTLLIWAVDDGSYDTPFTVTVTELP